MGGVARTLAYHYDPAGNRTRITHPGRQLRSAPIMTRSAADHGAARTARRRIAVLCYDAASARSAGEPRQRHAPAISGYDAVQRLRTVDHDYRRPAPRPTSPGRSAYNPAGQIAGEQPRQRRLRLDRPLCGQPRLHDQRAQPVHRRRRRQLRLRRQRQPDLGRQPAPTSTTSRTGWCRARTARRSTYDPLGRLYQVTLGAQHDPVPLRRRRSGRRI